MRWWICILIFAVLLSTPDVLAQSPSYSCTDLTNAINLTTSCEAFTTCDDTDAVCIQEGVSVLLDVCSQARYSDCALRTVLYWVANHNIQNDDTYLFHPDGFQPSLLATVSAFDNGDYQTAVLEFEDITQSEDYVPYFTLEILHGILYYADGDYDQALMHFNNAIDSDMHPDLSAFDNPLAYYFRGQVYRQWGDEERALQDFYTYDALATERLKTRLPLSSFRLALTNIQDQVLYPVFEYSSYGYRYADLTFAEPLDFQLSYRNDDDTLVISGLLERRFKETPEILFLERDPNNPSDYYLDLNSETTYGTQVDSYHLKITVRATHLNYYETIRHSEGTSTRVGIILPSGEQDIRTISSRRICDNSSLSFIQFGDIVALNNLDGEISLIDDPLLYDEFVALDYGDVEDTDTPYTVIEDPVCYDNAVWWRISNGTYTGWLTESEPLQENFFWSELSSPYRMLPRQLVETWETNNSGLAGIPTPLEFLGVAISGG